MDSGLHDGLLAKSAVAFRQVVRTPGVPWLRLHISDYNLGAQSYITITSLLDGGRQRLDARSLPQWGNWTAFFNGEAVEMELHVAPGEKGVFVRIEEIIAGARVGDTQDRPSSSGQAKTLSLCNDDDDRVGSNDPRVARLVMVNSVTAASCTPNLCMPICTAWLVSNGALLTAGHCVDLDPDGPGPLRPDRTVDLDANDIVEFNVFPSRPDGTPRFSNPADQYPVVPLSFTFEFEGEGIRTISNGDWAVFACAPNSTTGLLPHQAQGDFFRMTADTPDFFPPFILNDVRVIGYGLDNTPPGPGGAAAPCCDIDKDGNCDRNCNDRSLTQQTDSGLFQGELPLPFGSTYFFYHVDTTPATSGAPVIDEDNGFTIGINVVSGCAESEGLIGNMGQSFKYDPLEQALQNFPGPNTIYVDRVTYPDDDEDGTIFSPFHTVTEAIDAVPAGGIISIVRGSYSDKLTITKKVTLIAPVGTVSIGK